MLMSYSLLLSVVIASHVGLSPTNDDDRPNLVSGWAETANTDCGNELVCLGARSSLVNSSMATLIEGGCFPDGSGCSEAQSLVLVSLKKARDSIELERRESNLVLSFEQLQSASLDEERMLLVVEEWISTAEAVPCELSDQICDTGKLWLLGEADSAARSLPGCNEATKLGCWSDRSAVRDAIDARIAPIRASFFQRINWPDAGTWGASAANAAWTLVQHADADPDFQRAILERLNKMSSLSKTDKRHRAFLTDRVALASGEFQVYGTQGRCTESGWRMFAVIDASNLDERRAELGMIPIEDYTAEVSPACS